MENKKINLLKLLGLVILLIVGWTLFSYYNKDEKVEVNPEFLLAASMTCDDGSYFIAEFPTDNEVKIIADGKVVRKVPKVLDTLNLYENSFYKYSFAGEEVSVTNKLDGKTVVCNQPFDPNNAPVNFGDAGEGGAEQQDLVPVVSESILGRWQNVDDANFIREFEKDGKVNDTYGTNITANGRWIVFMEENAPNVTFELESSTAYLKIEIPEGSLHFKITKITPQEMELVYMDRGGVLKFKKL